ARRTARRQCDRNRACGCPTKAERGVRLASAGHQAPAAGKIPARARARIWFGTAIDLSPFWQSIGKMRSRIKKIRRTKSSDENMVQPEKNSSGSDRISWTDLWT